MRTYIISTQHIKNILHATTRSFTYLTLIRHTFPLRLVKLISIFLQIVSNFD